MKFSHPTLGGRCPCDVCHTIETGESTLLTASGIEAMAAGSTSPGKATQQMPEKVSPPPASRTTPYSGTQRAAVRPVSGIRDGHMSWCKERAQQSAFTSGESVRPRQCSEPRADRLSGAAAKNASLLPPHQTNDVNSGDIRSCNENGPDHDPLLILSRHPATSISCHVLTTSNSRTIRAPIVWLCATVSIASY